MNSIAIIILGAIGLDFILNVVADGLNLRHLSSALPGAFEGVYDPERYRKSQQYLKVNTHFGWVTSTFNLLLLLVFWFAKGFPLLDKWVRSFELGAILSGLIYIGILILLKSVLALPFSVYATFVIEERFGFNRTTWSTYLADLLKGLALALLLGTPLLAGILAFFQYAGANAWL
ncbi:MAG: M48 family peptidase, partial [Desulfobacterales bacterium]